ncbi:OmpA family protein [Massilia antarctica]|uniref:OmpA family protein n=2 Tax=Massilia antarctica TaxID=2765360 RepID=A0AA48WDL9_9BURK|nr:OmpA family protein [Massilia antarctica]
MNKMKKTAFAAALLCSAGLAFAQDFNPSWTIQPSVNGVKPDQDFGVSKRDYGGGLKLGKPVSEMWDVQIGATHARAKEGSANYRQTLLGADALLMLSRQNFRPFLLLGVGAERDRVDNPLRRVSKTSPYATAGIGFQLGLTDQWAMQADLRTVRGRLRHDEGFGTSASNNKYLTIGLNYAFDKPAAPPPPPAPPPAVTPPEPSPPPPPPPPPPPARFEKITLSATGLFAFNSATLNGEQPRLDEIAAALLADPGITDVDISGYADRLGSVKYNLKLSERRANAVRDYLVAKGVDGARLKAYGKGEANPVVSCTDKKRADLIKCLEPNRRVEVEQITIERRVQ